VAFDIGAWEFQAGTATATYTATLSMDAWLSKTITKEVSLDTILKRPGVFSKCGT
jgi:hypothetical protein